VQSQGDVSLAGQWGGAAEHGVASHEKGKWQQVLSQSVEMVVLLGVPQPVSWT